MSDETFDVVDRHDRVVGHAHRREVHAKGLLHRAIHVLIFNPTGQIFLQKRSMKKDIAAGLWDSSCSGHVDQGEGYDEACHRELGEELGLFLEKAPDRWFRIEACPETGQEFVWVYHLTHEGPFVLQPDEIETGAWFDPADLTAQIAAAPERFASAFRLIWRLLPAGA
jgi:isopentenyl-diphosphate delta-isomerase type 1